MRSVTLEGVVPELVAPRSRRARAAALAALCGLALAAGCGGEQSASGGTAAAPPLDRSQVEAALAEPAAGRSEAEAALDRRAGELLADASGGPVAQLDAELRALRGTPVVVNAWGEWCAPCRRELPLLQRAALAHRGEIAFLGVAVLTDRPKTEAYLRDEIALPYPSILDADGDVLAKTGIQSAPKTFFFDRAGKQVTVKQGEYRDAEELSADLERYAR